MDKIHILLVDDHTMFRSGLRVLLNLYSDFEASFSGWSAGSRRTVYFFTLVALFILAIAWVNYINLTTARARRSATIGPACPWRAETRT